MSKETSTPHTVLIVEDRIYTAKTLRADIDAHPALKAIAMAHNVGDALHAIQQHKPRFVLVDLGLPGGSGIDVIDAVQTVSWRCECVVISIFGDENRVLEALRAGAKGYILKNDPHRNIGKQIMDLIDGGSPMSPKIARLLLKIAQSGVNSHPQNDNDIPNLTGREMDVLQQLSYGFKRKEIAERLSVSVGTISTHINSIYGKLNVNSNIEAVIFAKSKKLL